ncbi:VanZ family protein [Constrictibacter sp. MBR-5]|jgi:VanZ family protein|uniref:VanZ family protein n=1 Tax=Constrictibacter sp. MBR-5 TaxID=3156467 RepID=UPI00339A1F36
MSRDLLRTLARAAFVVAALVVVVGSLTPAAEMPEIEVSDKIQHFAAYAGLAFLAKIAWRPPGFLGWPLASVVIAGPAIELLQSLVPGRSASVGDAVADVIGVGIGVICAVAVRRLLPASSPA